MVNQVGVKVEDVVQTLLEILKEWNISHYLLVVHSLSGIVALKLSHSQLPYAGLVTIEPTTYASIFGDLSEKPYPEWIDLQEKIRISGGTDAYLKEIAEEYLQPLFQILCSLFLRRLSSICRRKIQIFNSLGR